MLKTIEYMRSLFEILRFFLESGIFTYSLILFSFYITLSIFSAFSLIHYLRKNTFVDYNVIVSSPLAPSVSIIAPAYNEGMTIVENIRSLLSLQYIHFEVIIVNDGSTDDSMEKIIKVYSLEKVDYAYYPEIPTKLVRGIYKSKNKAFSKLLVIDKKNGGKSDSLNAGINVSDKKYFAAIDVDSLIEPDALLKMMKPFIESHDEKVIATGGVIRIINDCKVDNGRVVEVKFPKNFLARAQSLEYSRAFLMGRMAWSKLNGLLLISGAFGVFDKEVVKNCGGYNTKTVGEDMELIVRMRVYMEDRNERYSVVYIPDPLCWTEVPSDVNVLYKQRNRWTRGTLDTLFIHRKLFLNKKYGLLGLLSYPYWLFFEWLAPLVETVGIIYFIFIAVLGNPNWTFFIILLGYVYSFAITFSLWALLFEELTFHMYTKRKDIFKIVLTAMIEPIFYHPMTVWFQLRGNFHYFIGKSGWGSMKRKGFEKKKQ